MNGEMSCIACGKKAERGSEAAQGWIEAPNGKQGVCKECQTVRTYAAKKFIDAAVKMWESESK